MTTQSAPSDDLTSLAAQVGVQTAKFIRQIGTLRALTAQRERHGIDWSAYSLLFQIITDGPIRSSALAGLVCADPSTVSRQVATLVDHHLVERRLDPTDRRAWQLIATEAGQAVFARMRADRERIFATVLADWTSTDLTLLIELLGRLTTDIDRTRPRIRQVLTDTSPTAEPAPDAVGRTPTTFQENS